MQGACLVALINSWSEEHGFQKNIHSYRLADLLNLGPVPRRLAFNSASAAEFVAYYASNSRHITELKLRARQLLTSFALLLHIGERTGLGLAVIFADGIDVVLKYAFASARRHTHFAGEQDTGRFTNEHARSATGIPRTGRRTC
jgi:hypothetical protein